MRVKFISSIFFISFLLLGFAQENGPVSIGNTLPDFTSPKQYELGSITIEGADNFDHQAIKLIAGLKQGQRITIPGQQISKAIKNLWNEGLFSDIGIFVEKEIAGVVFLKIKVTPRPKLSRFKFKGVNKREVDKIRDEISLYTGKTITENLVYQTESKIKGYFRNKGYYSVSVGINRITDTLMNNSQIFLINIAKGKKVGIEKIILEGNKSIPTWKLKMAMKDTKERKLWRFFKRSKYTETAFEKDKQSILTKFNAIGLRDAQIVSDTVIKLNDKSIEIRLKINEGNKYYFGDIDWIGNTKFRSSYLDSILGIKKGDVYNKTLLDQRMTMSQDGRDISSLYMDRGYLFFQIIPVETNVSDNYINYQMRIIEGKEARIKRIIIKGNTKTNEHVIRREIRTKPGDLFNRNDIIRTQRELAQLGYFNEQAFQVNPMPNPADGTVDIEYVVEEKSSDQIELSGGYGGTGSMGKSRIVGTLGLTFNNFSAKNIFKKESWSPLPGGDGQRLSIRAQTNGTYYQSYVFSFTEPWMGGKKPNSLSFSLSNTSIGNGYLPTNSLYNGIKITGVSLGIGRRKKWPDDYFTANYRLSYQYYDVNNSSYLPLFTKGYANDISLEYILQRSSISAPIYPQSGMNMLFSAKSTLPYSLLGPDKNYATMTQQERYKFLEYYKFKFTGEWFIPLTSDKKLVLRPKFGFAFLGAYTKAKGIIPFERFTLGGSGLTGMARMAQEIIALRGYEDNAISTNGGDPLIAKYTLELRYPISLNPSATFYALAFAEAGNTYPSFDKFNPFNVKRTAGVGIRIFLPMFGMLGLDYGLGFDKLDYWSRGYQSNSDQSIDQKGYYPKLTFTIGMNLGEL
jgi:outer membrane protein insertion porin family